MYVKTEMKNNIDNRTLDEFQSNICQFLDIGNADEMNVYTNALEEVDVNKKLSSLLELCFNILSKNSKKNTGNQQQDRLLSYLSYFVSFFESVISGESVNRFFVSVENIETALGLVPKSYFENISNKVKILLKNYEIKEMPDSLINISDDKIIHKIRTLRELKNNVRHINLGTDELREHFEEICNLFEFSLVLLASIQPKGSDKEELEKKNSRISELEGEKERFQSSFDALNEENKNLKLSLRETTIELQNSIDEKNKVISSLEAKITECKKNEDRMAEEFNVIKKRSEDQAINYQNEVSKLKDHISLLKNNIDEIDSKDSEIAKLKAKIGSFEQHKSEQSKQSAYLKSQLELYNDLKKKYDKACDMNKSLNTELNEVKNENKSLMKKLSQIESELDRSKGSKADLHDKEKEIISLNESISNSKDEIAALQNKIKSLSNSNKHYIKENEMLSDKNASLRELHEMKTEMINQLKTQIQSFHDLKADYDRLQEQVSKKEELAQQLQAENILISQQLSKKTEVIQEVIKKHSESQKEVDSLKSLISEKLDYIGDFDRLKQELESLKFENQSLNTENENLHRKLSSVQELHRSQSEKFKSKSIELQRTNAKLTDKITHLESQNLEYKELLDTQRMLIDQNKPFKYNSTSGFSFSSSKY